MTRDERMKAFELRLDGLTWDEIADIVGYSSSNVEVDLKSCVNGRKRKSVCIYPTLRNILVREYGGSIHRFAGAVGMSYGSTYSCLTGRSSPEKNGYRICAFLGMTPEEAFGKKEFL